MALYSRMSAVPRIHHLGRIVENKLLVLFFVAVQITLEYGTEKICPGNGSLKLSM